MPLVLTLVGIAAASFALFWGVTLFAQKFLYNEPADKLPLRAAVAGLLLGCFLTAWVYVNTRADGEDKYGVIHQFKANDTSGPVAKFQAVRNKLDPNQKPIGGEETVSYEWLPTEKGERYTQTSPKPAGTPPPFAVASSTHGTVALIVDDAAGKPVRYKAVMDAKGYVGEKFTFQEEGGGRAILLTRGQDTAQTERLAVVSPSGGSVFLALLLNVLHLVVWFVVFWPVLRFNVGHAIGLAVVFFAMFTVLVMPMVFDMNKLPKPGIAATQPTTKS